MVWVLLAAVLTVGCGSPESTVPFTPTASPNVEFPKPYVVAGAWQDIEFVPLPGAPDRLPTFEAAVAQVRIYFLAGIHTQVADAG